MINKKDISAIMMQEAMIAQWRASEATFKPNSNNTRTLEWVSTVPMLPEVEQLGFHITWSDTTQPECAIHFFGSAEYMIDEQAKQFLLRIFGELSRQTINHFLAWELQRRTNGQPLPERIALTPKGVLLFDGIPVIRMSSYLCGTTSLRCVHHTREQCTRLQKICDALRNKIEYPYFVSNFEYNGFSGKTLPGLAPYTASFIDWTTDPGVVDMACSDGKKRRIPTYALETSLFFPQQPKTENTVLFGETCKSGSQHNDIKRFGMPKRFFLRKKTSGNSGGAYAVDVFYLFVGPWFQLLTNARNPLVKPAEKSIAVNAMVFSTRNVSTNTPRAIQIEMMVMSQGGSTSSLYEKNGINRKNTPQNGFNQMHPMRMHPVMVRTHSEFVQSFRICMFIFLFSCTVLIYLYTIKSSK